MVERVKQKRWIRENAIAIKRHYLRWPYRMRRSETFGDFSHEHICLAARFVNIDLGEICPLEDKKDLIPGDRDECERCRYFATICYQRDSQTGKKQIRLDANTSLLTLFEEK